MAKIRMSAVLAMTAMAVLLAIPVAANADTAVFDAKAEGLKPISLMGWGLRAAVPSSASAGVGGAVRRAEFEDVWIKKRLDENSPILMKFTVSGLHIPTASITVTSGSKQKYMKYCFRDVLLSSYDDSQSVADAPLERITFNFSSITLSYTPYSAAGAILTPVKFGWDILANLGVNYTC